MYFQEQGPYRRPKTRKWFSTSTGFVLQSLRDISAVDILHIFSAWSVGLFLILTGPPIILPCHDTAERCRCSYPDPGLGYLETILQVNINSTHTIHTIFFFRHGIRACRLMIRRRKRYGYCTPNIIFYSCGLPS